MIKNYLRSILRNLTRNRSFFLINVIGLAIALASSVLILFYLGHELSFEDHHSNKDRISRLTMRFEGNGFDQHWARVDRDWINQLPQEFPEVEHMIRFQDYYPRDFQINQDIFRVEHAFSVDQEVFEVFDFPLLQGDPTQALKEPGSIVLTQSLAHRFFGQVDPMDKTVLLIQDEGGKILKKPYQVTGIMKDTPSNTHLPINLLTSFEGPDHRVGWTYTYLLFSNSGAVAEFTPKLADFIRQHADEADQENLSLPLQALGEIHLQSQLAREITVNGSHVYVYVFALVAVFVLLMAIINFANLSTAQSLHRSKEIGIRKVMGSSRKELIIYFLLESCVFAGLGSVLAFAMVLIFFPQFQNLIGIQLPIETAQVFIYLLLMAILVGLCSGYYPGLVISRLNPILAIKGKGNYDSRVGRSNLVKNILVTIQLLLSIILISSALISHSQFEFLVNKKLGLERKQVYAITNLPDFAKDQYEILKSELLNIKGVEGVTACMEVPSREIRDQGGVYAEGIQEDSSTAPVMDIQVVDKNFFEIMEIEFMAGTTFTANLNPAYEPFHGVPVEEVFRILEQNNRSYVLNETAVRMIGWSDPAEAIGKNFSWGNGFVNLARGRIVGVVKDFHQESLRNRIDPVALVHEPIWFRNVLIRLNPQEVRTTTARIGEVWSGLFPDYPMESYFLDDMYNRLYQSENRQLEMLYLFSGLAIIIAFLGLFGLFSYILNIRVQELAIRRVLGATVRSLTLLLGKEYLGVTIIGILVGIPLTWYGMHLWLNGFAYRIPISGYPFVVAIILIALLLIATISVQTFQFSRRNPADILRNE